MFDNFPYTNFHEMNLDWMIKIAKDFLDQYTHIQETITQGLEDLDTKAQQLEALLQAWYDEHSQDITDQLADALNDLNDWYTEHQGFLDQYLQDAISDFNDAADAKAADTIASIPDDYTELFNSVVDLTNSLTETNDHIPYKEFPVYFDISGVNNFQGTGGYYKATDPYDFVEDTTNLHCTGLIYIKGYDTLNLQGRISNIGFAIAFFDSRKKILPNISIAGPSNVESIVSATINLHDDMYKNAFYCAVSYYGPEETQNPGFFRGIFIPIEKVNMHENLDIYGKLNMMKYPLYIRTATNVVTYDTTGNVESTGLIPIEKGVSVSAYIQMATLGYVIAFFDKYKNLIPALSVAGIGLNYSNFTITTDNYDNIAYVMISNYKGNNDNHGAVFITYADTENNFTNKIPYISGEHIISDMIGGWHSNGYNTGASAIHSTPLIPINNKLIDKIRSHTYVNPTYYKIAFFDSNKTLLTNISIKNAALADMYDTVDISGQEYDDVRYVSITSWKGSAGDIPDSEHWLYIHCYDYITALISHTKNLHTNNIFKKVVCVGDSYMEGWFQVAGDPTWSANPEYSWPHYMEHITGNQWVNLGISGATTWSWLSNSRGLAEAQRSGLTQAYVVGLLINDTAGQLGTPADIGTENNTYYAGLSKVIRSLAAISPDAHIFVLTCPRFQNETYDNFNEAVRTIVSTYENTYKVHLIDLVKNLQLYTIDSFMGDSINGHFTAIGYEQMAEFLNYLISDYINNNITAFQDVYKIPYNS